MTSGIGFRGRACIQNTPYVADITPPTGGVISGITNGADGALEVSWAAATDANGVHYEVYLQPNTSMGLFSLVNVVGVSVGSSLAVVREPTGGALVPGRTYYAGVRAVDRLGNRSANSTSLSLVATAAGYGALASQIASGFYSVTVLIGTPVNDSLLDDIREVKDETGIIAAVLAGGLNVNVVRINGNDVHDDGDGRMEVVGGGEELATDWTATERKQIRHRLGLNGDTEAPTEPVPDPIVITPSTPGTTTGYLVVRHGDSSLPAAGQVVSLRCLSEPTGDTGTLFLGTVRAATSDSNGLCQWTGLRPGATYSIRLGTGAVEITIPADHEDETCELPSFRA